MKPLFKYHCSIQTNEGAVINTWGIYPVTSDAKILDGIYDPENKVLKLLFDSVKEDLVPYPTGKRDKEGRYITQERRLDTYYKGSISEEDVEAFLDLYVENNFTYLPDNKKIIMSE